MYGMLYTQGISNIPEVVEVRGTHKKNTKTVGKLILESEYKIANALEPILFIKAHQEGDKVVLEGKHRGHG